MFVGGLMKTLFALCLLALGLPVLAEELPCTCTCACQVPGKPPPVTPPVETPRVGMKFHPGHYMTLDPIRTSPEVRARHFKEIDAIANEPVMGVKLWLFWGAMETKEGDYSAGFAILDEYLKKLSGSNKYLILSVQERVFGKYDPAQESQIFPTYITAKYGKTVGRNVTTLRVWQPAVMDRYIALVRALAARYEKHPNFEMLQAEETSLAVTNGLDGFSLTAYGAQLQRLLTEARKVFPTTQIRLSTNFYGSDSQMLELLRFCDLLDIAVGGPDVIPNQTIQANRMYESHLKGRMVWVAEVQSPSLGGHEGTFTARELYESAMNQAPSYFLWYRNTWSGGTAQKWDSGLLPFIRSVQGRTTTACPANLVCNTK